jgi:hypothetical protein
MTVSVLHIMQHKTEFENEIKVCTKVKSLERHVSVTSHTKAIATFAVISSNTDDGFTT